MSRLTVFSLYVIVLVVICAFVWDYSHTKGQLGDARRDLVTAQYNFDQCTAARQSDAAYTAALHNQASASQQNCAQTILSTQKLFDLALPPQNFGIPPIEGAVEVFAPASAAPQNITVTVNDHAFTNFLNTW